MLNMEFAIWSRMLATMAWKSSSLVRTPSAASFWRAASKSARQSLASSMSWSLNATRISSKTSWVLISARQSPPSMTMASSSGMPWVMVFTSARLQRACMTKSRRSDIIISCSATIGSPVSWDTARRRSYSRA